MSFEVLRDIKRENREAEERATRDGPVACPIDGTPLEINANVTTTGDLTMTSGAKITVASGKKIIFSN